MRIVRPDGERAEPADQGMQSPIQCRAPEHHHEDQLAQVLKRTNGPITRADLSELLVGIRDGKELRPELIPAFRLAIDEQVLEYRDSSELAYSIARSEAEQEALAAELERLKDKKLRNPVIEGDQIPEELKERVGTLFEGVAELDKKAVALQRNYASFAIRWLDSVRCSLKQLPAVCHLVSSAPDLKSQMRALDEDRLHALEELQVAHEELIVFTSRNPQAIKHAQDVDREIEKLEVRREKVGDALDDLKTFKSCCFGAVRFTPEGRLLTYALLSQPQLGSASVAEVFKHQRLVHERICKQIDRAAEISERLVEEWSYPKKGADLIAWQLVSRPGETQDLTESFHQSNLIFSKTLEPSYAQLLLTLQLGVDQKAGAEVLESLAPLCTALPNFPEAERFLIALAKQAVLGDEAGAKQERLFTFVNLLTGPLGEHLDGFERHMIAARLGAFEGEPVSIAERYAQTFKRLLDLELPPAFRTSLAAVTLLHSESRGEKRVDPFERTLKLEQELEFERDEQALLDAAFISMLPGDPAVYLQPILIARQELLKRGFSVAEAGALVLPVALESIEESLEQEIDREAERIALKVKRLDSASSGGHFNADERELHQARVQEQVLSELSRLQELYDRSSNFNLFGMWERVAGAACATVVKDFDAQTLSNGSEAESLTPSPRQVMDDLLATHEELLRRIRVLQFGPEEQT